MGLESLLSEEQVKKLKKEGILSPISFAIHSFDGLRRAGFSEEEAERLIQRVEEDVAWMLRGKRAVELGRNRFVIKTGSASLDQILGGGVRSGLLTDFFGESGVGKTQLLFQLCINAVRDGRALFVDTEATFRPERIVEMCEARGLDGEHVLRSILVLNLRSLEEQLAFLKRLEGLSSPKGIRLIAIDTLTRNFLQLYGEEGLIKRQSLIARHLHDLAILASRKNLAIVLTNTVRSRADGMGLTEVGGHVVAHLLHVRVHLLRRNGRRVAHLIRPPFEPLEAYYKIAKEGIVDER